MKNKLIAGYLMIALVYGVFAWLFGDYRYRSFMYNLGRGLVWPVNVLHSTPHLDGSSPQAYGQSFGRVASGHDGAEDQARLYDAMGRIAFYYYLQDNPGITQAQYGRMMANPLAIMSMNEDVMSSLMTQPQLLAEVARYTDGMSFGDVVASVRDIQKKTDELMASRPAGSAADVAVGAPQIPEQAPTATAPASAPAPMIASAPALAPVTPATATDAASIPQAAQTAAAPTTPVKPSFDCARASNTNEVAICQSPDLAHKDLELAGKYKLLYAEAADKPALKTAQMTWMQRRNLCDGNEPCLVTAYDQRIRQIDQQLQAPAQ